jgi:hypothetical protein
LVKYKEGQPRREKRAAKKASKPRVWKVKLEKSQLRKNVGQGRATDFSTVEKSTANDVAHEAKISSNFGVHRMYKWFVQAHC